MTLKVKEGPLQSRCDANDLTERNEESVVCSVPKLATTNQLSCVKWLNHLSESSSWDS